MGNSNTVVETNDKLVVYVLKLKENKYYVGSTKNIERRYKEHQSGTGSEWTKKYPPVKLMYTKPISSTLEEDLETKVLMEKYGIDNVRGGTHCQIELPSAAKQTLEKELAHASGACFKCGKPGHFVKDCTVVCGRCGFNSHSSDKCRAYTNKEGKFLCHAKGTSCKAVVKSKGELCTKHKK